MSATTGSWSISTIELTRSSSLEHICWDHFEHADLAPSVGDEDVSAEGDASGHAMMATSLALRTAPRAVFDSISQTAKARKKSKAAMPADDVTWQASGLTLQSLHDLASSLNAADKELTPVQAWIELAGQYPLTLLLREDVIQELKAAFLGVVKWCPLWRRH